MEMDTDPTGKASPAAGKPEPLAETKKIQMDTCPKETPALPMGNRNHWLEQKDWNGHWPAGRASPADGKPEPSAGTKRWKWTPAYWKSNTDGKPEPRIGQK